MPPRPFVNDGLWRCLCPGFPQNAAVTPIPRAGAKLAQRNASRKDATTHPTRQLRAYNSSSTSAATNEPFFTQPGVVAAGFRPFGEQHRPAPSHNPRDKPPLAQLPTYVLYDHARAEGSKGQFDEVMKICRILIRDRGEQPNKDMYTAILHSFVSSTNGTAGKVRKVLEEMGFFGDTDTSYSGRPKIELDARGCECVLEVLAVHPDYLLRAKVLEYMKARWFTLSDRGRNFVIAGMLRERHFEHALESMEEMVRKQARVENWLFDKAIWILLEFGEVDEAFYVLSLKEGVQARTNGTGTVKLSDALWGTLLDAAAQKQLVSYTSVANLHVKILTTTQHEASTMVWMTQVHPGYLKPSTGTCLSVLTLASRYGHVQLATDVFRVLTERETTLTTHHYELLIATYLKANDLSAALSIVLIMVDASLKVDAGTCQPLYLHLAAEKDGESSRPMQAFALLQEFEAAGRKIPTAAVNACIQASVALDRLAEAIEIYKALHTVSHAGPNTNTFNTLFRGCHRSSRKELAMFFANEMIQLGLDPDRITYDRLILVCLQAGDLEDALLYYEEMMSISASSGKKRKMKPRSRTWELLIHTCVVQGDERAVALLKAYKAGVEEPRRGVEKAVVDRFEYGIIPPTEMHRGQAQNEKSASVGMEDPHVTPAMDVETSPGTGAYTELSDKSSGVNQQGLDLKAATEGEKRAGARDGLAQLMEASKSTKPY